MYFLYSCGTKGQLNVTSFESVADAYICGIQSALTNTSAYYGNAGTSCTSSKKTLMFYVLMSLLVSSYFQL